MAGAQTYAARLGRKTGDRVVILHVDDAAGISHEFDVGLEQATNPGFDAGLHLTLASE